MGALIQGDYAGQWVQLASLAQRQWPSEAARNSMLAAKFSGDARPVSFQLGALSSGVSWVSPENPSQTISGAYRIPVSLTFQAPAQLNPAGVATFYRSLALVLSDSNGNVQVVGEGPASPDAPVIVPPSPSSRSAAVPILMYHVVAPFPIRSQWNSSYAYALEYGLTVTPSQFAGQMAYLNSAGAHAISLTRLTDFLDYGLPLPPHPVVITFDDGRESPYQYAVPVLKQYGLTATFFIPTGLVGKSVTTATHTNPQHYMTWAQIDQLAAGGFSIEDHTLHDNVALWGLPSSEVQRLAGQSAATLEQQTGKAVQFIAYSGLWPYPSPTQSGPAETSLFSQLAQLGYVGGAVDARVDSAQQSTGEIWQMPRVRMNPNEAGSALAQWVPR